MPDDDRDWRPGGALAVARRAPFSDNPKVGARGQRTQQRILDAALRAFGDEGYHGCSVERITTLARCSRVSFYQYFASKEDVFQHLVGQVARQLSASTAALDPVGPDVAGWEALRAWVARYGEIYARYEPVFNAYQLAAQGNDAAATWRGDESTAGIHAKLVATTLPPRQLDPVIGLLVECLNHALDVAGILRSLSEDAYPSERLECAITDVMHRTLFGVRPDVNVRPGSGSSTPARDLDRAALELLQYDEQAVGSNRFRALDALLESGRDVFVQRGYHNTRVDDLAAAAGVSHGVFYRYFGNKGELARVLTARALQSIGSTLVELPDVAAPEDTARSAALRRWLRRYNAAHVNEAAMLRVWIDGALQDRTLTPEFAATLEWGRQRLSRYLRARAFGDSSGDVDMDAVVLVALLGVFGPRPRPAAEVDAAAHIIERGLFGR
jgi:AcrR family transcriptional regulator